MARRDDEDEFEARLCRLDGRRPTARDRWQAFHRLWRLAHGHGAAHDIDASTCFHVLFDDWQFGSLLTRPTNDGYVNQSHVPKPLRKTLLAARRKKRLYGGGRYNMIERDREIARRCREDLGLEVLPIEVAEIRHRVVATARARAAELDVSLPADDQEVLRLIGQSVEKRDRRQP